MQYEERVTKYCSQLEQQMAGSVGNVINLSSWFHFFSFDVMGDLSFGKSFNMLQTGKKHFAIDLMDNGMTLLGLFTPTPWLARIGFSIPGVATGWKKMFVWSDEQMRERLESKAERSDITSWLIEASRKSDSIEADRNWLNGDAFGIVIAGSDTTASTLVFLFCHLAQDPTQVDKIRRELVKSDSGFDGKTLQSLPHLNGFINETLRLHPPVPSAGLRITPPEGLTVVDRYIPGNTTVVVPVYSLHRRKS
jgi:tryprostatin B 6-hydroxylase